VTEKLNELMRRCKGGVYLKLNEHRDFYDSAKQHLENLEAVRCAPLDIPADVRNLMEDTDTIVSVQLYQRTPICFDEVYHYDIDAALDKALEMTKDPA